MAANPWDPVQPTAASALIEKCLGCGVLTQNELDQTQQEFVCFSRVDDVAKISDIKAEINQKSLELELLKLEQKTADITHPVFLSKKCQVLQVMNSHLEAVLKEKRTLRQRLAKPLCQENLPIEASYHRSAAELLTLAVNFIEKLEVYLQSIQAIPKIPESANNMDNALVKMECLEAEIEEVTERILLWREEQYGLLQATYRNNREASSGSISANTSYLSIENLHP
ncbi:HAUS augmin-like complex subunit 2 [Spea bombifrons]|uniref:HAUS augmin-like complex subunit 2 n=1 Tax=Spea bombifrons TaxID=233779 RepID=UPI0023493B1A|nr:HAUS augmin-like complex subunit 2 [Spea bombifrons]